MLLRPDRSPDRTEIKTPVSNDRRVRLERVVKRRTHAVCPLPLDMAGAVVRDFRIPRADAPATPHYGIGDLGDLTLSPAA